MRSFGKTSFPAKRNQPAKLASIALALLPVLGWAGSDGRAIALNCMTCHRQSSENAPGQIPSLAGLSEHQIKQVLLDFKYDRKQATLMPRIAKGYSDQELSEVAAHLARH
ncbi:MAG: c-type cytochrome [Gammaproteobacteria bacterium]